MLEYSHMGDTKMRLRNSTPRIVSGSNSGIGVLLVMSNCTNRAKWGRPMDAPRRAGVAFPMLDSAPRFDETSDAGLAHERFGLRGTSAHCSANATRTFY